MSRAAEIVSGKLRFTLLALPVLTPDFSHLSVSLDELKRLGLIVCRHNCNEKDGAGNTRRGVSPAAATSADAAL